MNDPGLDQPIGEADQQVHDVVDDQADKDEQDYKNMDEEVAEKNFLMPARWWYASTAFPLIAGTFGPMANAFSICALVENWRVKVPKGGSEEHGIDLKDPSWLIAVNAVSLSCALIANLSLLLNMARRVPFKIAQPITILGFWIASVLLIGLLAAANTHSFHEEGVQNQALTQAYYYAIFAAGLYQIISYLMCVTVYGAYRGYYSKEFKLTVAQRTLMLQTISFLVYQHVWSLAYAHIEGWKFLDAVYWADFTSLTIGIGGDYVPETHLGRSLLFPFAIGGIVILGLVVGSIRSLVLDRGKKKMAARMTEKTRRRLVKRIAKDMEKSESKRKKRVLGMKQDMVRALTLKPGEGDITEKDRRQYEFEAMRRVQRAAARERKYISLATSLSAWAFLWFMGAFIFWKTEYKQKWTYFESVYFAYTSLLTIGYGDFQVESNSGKPFFVFWSLLAIPSLTILISNMGDTVIKGVKDVTIWLGEVTVLPSNEASVMDRLKYGIFKTTLGFLQDDTKPRRSGKDIEDSSSDDYQEMHPGLAKVLGQRPFKKIKKKQAEMQDRMTTDFEEAEKEEEDQAEKDGDDILADEHRYRRELLEQIRRVYTDSTAAEPKHYDYEEWAYFLRLLGEDESDERYHRRARRHHILNRKALKKAHTTPAAKEMQDYAEAGQQGAFRPSSSDENQDGEHEIVPWSWIGNRSPLMGDKDEPEWILDKLFERLEESTRNIGMEEKREQKDGANARGYQDGNPADENNTLEQFHEAKEQLPAE